jgi:hypothetical protein
MGFFRVPTKTLHCINRYAHISRPAGEVTFTPVAGRIQVIRDIAFEA